MEGTDRCRGECPRWGREVPEQVGHLPVISLLGLITIEYGGWSLLGLITKPDQLGEFRERFFRAGHAGVLSVLALIYFLYLDRTGFFVHLAVGQPKRSSLGTVVTRVGAVLLGVALVVPVVGLFMRG